MRTGWFSASPGKNQRILVAWETAVKEKFWNRRKHGHNVTWLIFPPVSLGPETRLPGESFAGWNGRENHHRCAHTTLRFGDWDDVEPHLVMSGDTDLWHWGRGHYWVGARNISNPPVTLRTRGSEVPQDRERPEGGSGLGLWRRVLSLRKHLRWKEEENPIGRRSENTEYRWGHKSHPRETKASPSLV